MVHAEVAENAERRQKKKQRLLRGITWIKKLIYASIHVIPL